MSNTFYKPKNELGHLLASESFVNNEIEKLDNKLSNIIDDLEQEVTGGVNQITGRPSINVEIISYGVPVEEYLRLLWQNCKDQDERMALKTKIGRTLYLRPALEKDTSIYEEYICINPTDIRVENSMLGDNILFDRLGSGEANLGTSKIPGSVKLVSSLFDISSEEWNSYSFEETVAGEPTGKYLPVDGVGVAPMALHAFAAKIKENEQKITNAEEWINNTKTWISDTDTKILDILDALKDDENEVDPNSRLNIIESDVTNIENIIGINGCCAICGEKGCSCNCEGDVNSLDCSIICKINSLEEGLTDNSDQLVAVSDELGVITSDITAIRKDISSANTTINNIKNNIDDINKTIGKKDSSLIKTTIWDQIKHEDTLISEIGDSIDNIKNDIGSITDTPDENGNLYAQIKQNRVDINNIDKVIGTLTSNGNADGTLYERIKQNTNDIDLISAEVNTIAAKIGSSSEIIPNGTVYQHIEQNKVDIENINNIIGTQNDSINSEGSLFARVKKNSDDINILNGSTIESTNRVKALEESNKFNTILLSCEIPAENFETTEIEATLEISYDKIVEAIKEVTGKIIAPSNLTIIFNGARFTAFSNSLNIEHFYPEVIYKGFDDLENISRRSLVLKFAGYNEVRYALISLSYYDNSLVTPYKIN